MLTIGMVTAKGGRYYTGLVVRPDSDYYAGGGESPGRWLENRAAQVERFRGEVIGQRNPWLFTGEHQSAGERRSREQSQPAYAEAVIACAWASRAAIRPASRHPLG